MSERRKYTLRRRAEQMAETRRRIVQAAVELHASVGPSKTSITAIAERADVDRVTVYHHFPDERSLFQACVKHGLELMPPPDPANWAVIDDPRERLRTALRQLYAYYRNTESAWANILPDLPRMPALLEANAPVLALWEQMRETLLRGWGLRGRHRIELRAVIALALDFHAWRALAQSGVGDRQAADLVVRVASCLARPQRHDPRA
jgi:AcrR family transcriptional regulator